MWKPPKNKRQLGSHSLHLAMQRMISRRRVHEQLTYSRLRACATTAFRNESQEIGRKIRMNIQIVPYKNTQVHYPERGLRPGFFYGVLPEPGPFISPMAYLAQWCLLKDQLTSGLGLWQQGARYPQDSLKILGQALARADGSSDATRTACQTSQLKPGRCQVGSVRTREGAATCEEQKSREALEGQNSKTRLRDASSFAQPDRRMSADQTSSAESQLRRVFKLKVCCKALRTTGLDMPGSHCLGGGLHIQAAANK